MKEKYCIHGIGKNQRNEEYASWSSITRQLYLCPVLDEKLLQHGTVAMILVLAITAHGKVGRVRQHGQEFQVMSGP
jgi:hypothetical protein